MSPRRSRWQAWSRWSTCAPLARRPDADIDPRSRTPTTHRLPPRHDGERVVYPAACSPPWSCTARPHRPDGVRPLALTSRSGTARWATPHADALDSGMATIAPDEVLDALASLIRGLLDL